MEIPQIITSEMLWSSFAPLILFIAIFGTIIAVIVGVIQAKFARWEEKRQAEIQKETIKKALREIEEEKARR